MTSKDFKEYVIEQLSALENITCRPMMGEYLLYYNGILFGGIYDGRVLVKMVENNKKYDMKEEIPYKGAKLMYYLEDLEDSDFVRNVIIDTCQNLKKK